MINLEPINQTKLLGLDKHISEFIRLYENDKFPNKIMISGQKGIGKSTLAYHFVNYALSKDEDFNYDLNSTKINPENQSYKTVINKSNPNLKIIDVGIEKKKIDINQIRDLILNLNKSSFNTKPRFVLIDNIEFLNKNSINALLKVLEEPNTNVYFILINNNKKVLSTLLSRCINYKISFSNSENLQVANYLLNGKLNDLINKDLVNYYLTAGNIYNLYKFGDLYGYDMLNIDLRNFIKAIIKGNHYKKDNLIKYLFFDLIEFYFRKINTSSSKKTYEKYRYFLKRISDTKNYNLDEEVLFIQFDEEVLNG